MNRNFLLQDPRNIFEPDEIHILKVLICNVKLCVRNGDTVGEEFLTDISVPQGDCLSPILFTLYLAQALKTPNQQNTENKCYDHSYAKNNNETSDVFVKDSNIPEHMCDHNYVECKESGLTIDQQFADDVGWATTSKNKTKQIEIEAEQKLNKRNLKLNKTKTEKYKISGNKDDDNSWKKCTYLYLFYLFISSSYPFT